MFQLEALATLPIEVIQIDSVSVRGALGPLTVWVTEGHWVSLGGGGVGGNESTRPPPNPQEGKSEREKEWVCVYTATHKASFDSMVALQLTTPIQVKAGCSISLYGEQGSGPRVAVH